MRKLFELNEVPPEGYRFVCPASLFEVVSNSFKDLLRIVEDHYKGNGFPLKDNWKEIVEDRVCAKIPSRWFTYSSKIEWECKVDLMKIKEGAYTIYNLIFNKLTGKEVFTSPVEATTRAKICAACPLNMFSKNCFTCSAVPELAEKLKAIKGQRKTPYDDKLRSCCVCGCLCETIIHIDKSVFTETKDYPNWCWKKNEDLEECYKLLQI